VSKNTAQIVVTGASGFIGSHLVKLLHREGEDYYAATRRKCSENCYQQVESYQDIAPTPTLVHLAENNDRVEVNQLGDEYVTKTVGALRQLLEVGHQQIVYLSSSAVYGDGLQAAVDESARVFNSDDYAEVKLKCEKMVLDRGGVVVRLSNVYGPGMSKKNVLTKVLGQLSQSCDLQVWDDRPIRDFVWVEDVVTAIYLLIKGKTAGIYNVGSGVGSSIRFVAETALEVSGEIGRKLVVTNANIEASSCNILNISKIEQELGWSPAITLKDGLSRLIR
jgi:nucleoside-diphosphate-sugar epimerase